LYLRYSRRLRNNVCSPLFGARRRDWRSIRIIIYIYISTYRFYYYCMYNMYIIYTYRYYVHRCYIHFVYFIIHNIILYTRRVGGNGGRRVGAGLCFFILIFRLREDSHRDDCRRDLVDWNHNNIIQIEIHSRSRRYNIIWYIGMQRLYIYIYIYMYITKFGPHT